MTHTIGEDCTGCTLCARKCPAQCISGVKKRLHVIDPNLCFDCGVCASYCPVSCILDDLGAPTTKVKPKERPVAAVDETFCSGCECCVDICPFDCIEMVEDEPTGAVSRVAEVARPKDCVACRLCAVVCGDKEAIVVRWPDGERCLTLNRLAPVEEAEAKMAPPQ